MITSNQILKISEELLTSVPSNFKKDEPIDIYTNPSSSDITKLRKLTTNYVRFIADANNKTLYVWNGESALHSQVAKHLNLLRRIESLPDNTLVGTADINGNRLVSRTSDSIYQMLSNLKVYKTEIPGNSYAVKQLEYLKTVSNKFNWVSRYLDISEIVNMINRNLNR